MKIARDLSTFLSYPIGDQARLLVAAGLLIVLSRILDLAPFERVRRLLLWLSESGSAIVPGDPTPARVVGAVELADRALPGTYTCLERSLTTEVLLRLYAFTPQHRIGVKKASDGSVKAHSWLEFDGDIVIGDLDNLSQYEPLPPLNRGENP